MSILDKIITTAPRAPRITIYGKPGIGKTSLASQFPAALFLMTEEINIDGLKALPKAEAFTEFWNNVKGLLAQEDLPYKTIVVDSVSKLDELIVKHILAEEPANISAANNGDKPRINTLGASCGGYGKGYERAQSMHRAMKAQLDKFTDKGMGVVFISHVTTTKYRAPDNEDYDIYSIVMNHDKSREVYIDDVDAVLFIKLYSGTTTLDSGRTIVRSTDKRTLITNVNEVNVSKNRYSMPPEIPVAFEEIKKYIPFYNLEK